MNAKYKMTDESLQLLSEMMTTVSPSMEEARIAELMRREWGKYCDSVQSDVMGNVYASFPEVPGRLNIGMVAHMDSIGVQITHILPCGMLQFRSIGLRPHTLLGQQMQIITSKGLVNAVVGFDATSQFGQPKGLIEDDLWLDIGASSYEEAANLVTVGDMAVFRPMVVKLEGNTVSGTSIDDRIGLLVLTECMRLLKETAPDVNLYFVGSTQEEVGLRGSQIIGAKVQLDVCFVVDVDYATDIPFPHENQMGRLHLSGGPGLQRKADTNFPLVRFVESVAMKSELPCQITVGRFVYGGTDAAALQVQQSGTATANVSIPCRNMHSPAEICHLDDVENTVRLLTAVIKELEGKGKGSFIPSR